MRVKLCFRVIEKTIPITFQNVSYIGVERPSDYDGPTNVLPSFETQLLPTQGKTLNTDIEVSPIRVTAVSNHSGGKTVSI